MSDSLLMTSYRVWFNLEGKITPFLTFTEIVFKKNYQTPFIPDCALPS